MKKIIAVILALWAFAAFSFAVGCKKAEEATGPTTGEEQTEEAPAPEQPAEEEE